MCFSSVVLFIVEKPVLVYYHNSLENNKPINPALPGKARKRQVFCKNMKIQKYLFF